MSELLPLAFENTPYPVIVTTSNGVQYTALTLDWVYLRKDWAAPTGLMLEVADPTANAPVGQKLKVFVPWNSVRWVTQVVPAPEVPPVETLKV
jgi:hypothetical protein